MANSPAVVIAPAKTEAELIATVANIQDVEGSLLFAHWAAFSRRPQVVGCT